MLDSSTQTGSKVQGLKGSIPIFFKSSERLEGERCQPRCLGEGLDRHPDRAAGLCEEEPHYWAHLEPSRRCGCRTSWRGRR